MFLYNYFNYLKGSNNNQNMKYHKFEANHRLDYYNLLPFYIINKEEFSLINHSILLMH